VRDAELAKFLSVGRLRAAIESLGRSAAHKRLAEYLIIKRALVLTDQSIAAASASEPALVEGRAKRRGYVILSTRNPDLEHAIEDIMQWNRGPSASADAGELPYLNVFGTGEHEDRGYRVARYLSNGLATTVNGLPWRQIVDLANERPREASLRPDRIAHLAEFFLKGTGAQPYLEDAAVWYARGRDVTPHLRETYSDTMSALVSVFVEELALTDEELDALFDRSIREDFVVA
jgi:hypothetical protein